jgi:hypothetical protein
MTCDISTAKPHNQYKAIATKQEIINIVYLENLDGFKHQYESTYKITYHTIFKVMK